LRASHILIYVRKKLQPPAAKANLFKGQ